MFQKIAELRENGYCVLKAQLPLASIEACKRAFWPLLLEYLKHHADERNRGPHRHFLPMPFEPPCFAPEFFFNPDILEVVRGAMGSRVVADQWGCDVPVPGSEYQNFHADYQRPLFEELPDLPLPPYILVASFGLISITPEHGPIEIAPGTHRIPREVALRSVESSEIPAHSLLLEPGDVLVRHPWALHRGTPNRTGTPRPLLSVRYVRRWYADHSREVNSIPRSLWESLNEEQRALLRFPIASE